MKAEATKERIAELEAEVARLKRIARCPHEPRPGLGGVIQTLRQERGLGMGKLAELAGISKGRLSLVENTDNANMTVKMLRSIAAALHMPASQLLVRLEAQSSRN